MDEDRKRQNGARRLDFQSNLGMTRRELLRRGAVVGGTLLWVAPAIQSVSAPAFAQGVSGACATCYCRSGRNPDNPRKDLCTTDGVVGVLASEADCREFCASAAAAGGPYNGAQSQYCQGVGTDCRCSSKRANNSPPFGVNCT